MIEPAPLQQIDRTYVRVGRRRLSYFSGCDYFRLSSDPKVLEAAASGLKRYGLNVAASRLTSGNHVLYQQLERSLARYFSVEDALLVPSGYLTNLVLAQALARSFSHVLIDERAHLSLIDAARLLDCPVLQFKHRQPESLAATIRRCGPEARVIVLTDGMFSHDGSAAPLAEYAKVLPKDGMLLVDDAHGAGVLGRTGRGALEHASLRRSRCIQTVTLSKAFGCYGGAILGTRALRRRILDRSPLLTGSTPLPLPLANAALHSIRLLGTDKSLRERLWSNSSYVKNALCAGGFSVSETPGPIIAWTPATKAQAARLSRALLSAGIYPPFIHYPNGPASGYFRFVISSEHSREQLDGLVKALTKNCGGA